MAMAFAGLANGIAQPAGNLAIARGVANSRQGLAFGIKQSAIPGATLVAGGMVSLIGAVLTWRAAFLILSVGAVLLAFAMPKDPYRTVLRRPGAMLREGDVPLLPLIVLAGAAFCGAAVGTSLASFFVGSAVTGGVDARTAGLLLAFGSGTGILSRLVIGWSADRRVGGHLNVVMLLLSLGAVGFAGLAARGSLSLLAAATVLAFAAGWGWPGLFNFTVVRLNPNAPAAATAITQTGVFVGGVIGPAAFGRIVDLASYETAWLAAAAVNVVGTGVVLAGRTLLRRARAAGGPARAES
jgi:predicted MFS family arabinose efflux permease